MAYPAVPSYLHTLTIPTPFPAGPVNVYLAEGDPPIRGGWVKYLLKIVDLCAGPCYSSGTLAQQVTLTVVQA